MKTILKAGTFGGLIALTAGAGVFGGLHERHPVERIIETYTPERIEKAVRSHGKAEASAPRTRKHSLRGKEGPKPALPPRTHKRQPGDDSANDLNRRELP